jgi:hypothetical protein
MKRRGGRPPTVPDLAICDGATPTQVTYIRATLEHGGMRPAARALGVHYNTVKYCVAAAQRNWDARHKFPELANAKTPGAAAAKGWAPDYDLTHPVPDPLVMRGASILYGADGGIKLQWVKSQLDNVKWEQVKRAILAAFAVELPKEPATPAPEITAPHLATVYTLTDSHVGMLAWGRETGADWDLKIAQRVLTGCFDHMIEAAPPADVGIVSQLGDFLHQDGLAAVTPTSGHNLDSDGRFEKIIEVAVAVLRYVVKRALEKHRTVVLLIAEGNHDMVSSIWLRKLFNVVYENEPRVTVIDSALPYYVHQHGKTMLGFHHGHLKKNNELPLLMAAQFPEVWGATKHRYVHVGHRHHTEIKEHSGITVTQHPTLASRDAYAARGGWIAERQVTAITYHDIHGQVRADTVVPEMLEAV